MLKNVKIWVIKVKNCRKFGFLRSKFWINLLKFCFLVNQVKSFQFVGQKIGQKFD